jgi:hypothetical protein
MELKTSELTGSALDWAVAKCEGFNATQYESKRLAILHRRDDAQPRAFVPSSDWSQGGPIIERERITLECTSDTGWFTAEFRSNDKNRFPAYGPSPLVAAMRCYIASKLGDTVTIPDELC